MKIHEFTVAPGQREAMFRVSKTVQELLIVRTSTLALMTLGLALGIPEEVALEIENPNRPRVAGAESTPLGHIVFWGQHGRGPITETAQAAGLSNIKFGDETVKTDANQYATATFHYYVNDKGPLEVTNDDNFTVVISDLAPAGTKYTIYAPEMPIIPAFANEYFKYETSLVMQDDTSKKIDARGKQGLIIPNNPAAIKRVLINYQVDQYTSKDVSLSIEELLIAQSDANPNVVATNFTSADPAQRRTVFSPSANAAYLLVMLPSANSVELFVELGQEVRYTTIEVADRNRPA